MLWLSFSVLLWGFIHSLLALQKVKEVAISRIGESITRFYRLAYNLFAGLSFLPVLMIAAVTPDRLLYIIPLPWFILMIIGEFLAVVVIIIGILQTDPWEFIGLRQLSSPANNGYPGRSMVTAGGKLVKSGLYRYVRHPLYSAGLALIWLVPRMTLNVLAINIGLTIYIVVGAYFEERKLKREFGQEYSDYAAITPMLIPFLKGNKMPG